MTTKTAPIETLSFEQALQALEAIVTKLEKGQIDLENAIESYAQGSALRMHCQQKLDEAKLKIETLTPAQTA